MADFYVPLATDVFSNLNQQIAAGPPKPDLGFVQNALENYKAGGDIRQQIGLRDMFQNGVPQTADGSPDYRAISNQLLQVGGAGQVQNTIGLGNYQLGRDLLSAGGQPGMGPPSSATSIPNSAPRQQTAYAGQPNVPADVPTGTRMPPGQNLTDPNTTITRVDYSPPENGPFQRTAGGQTTMAQAQPQSAPQTFDSRFSATRDNPNAQPGMDQVTADRYEQVAQQAYRKSQAAALINPAMSTALKAQGDAYMKQAEIIRGAIAKNSETTPEQKNANSSGGMTPRGYEAAKEGDKEDNTAYQKDWSGLQNAGRQAAPGMQKAQLAKNLTLDPNFYSGPLHEGVQTFNQFRAIFGSNPASATPQEAFQKVANDMLQEQIKSMGQSGVGRVLQSEVNIMKQALASLGITPQSNRALLEIVSRVYQHNQDIADITRNIQAPPGQKSAALNGTVDQYLKSHPLFSQQELQHPQTLGAPDAPPQLTKMPPQQVRQWAQGIGLKPGDPMRLNGQVVSVP